MPHPGWKFCLLWIIVTPLGSVLSQIMTGESENVFTPAITGLIIGLLQYLILRPYLRGATWWILATTIGIAVSGFIRPSVAFFTTVPMAGAAGGMVMGLAQWPVLYRQFSGIAWWLGATTVGGGLSWAMSEPIVQSMFRTIGNTPVGRFLVFPAVIAILWAVMAAVTGLVLVWRLRRTVARR